MKGASKKKCSKIEEHSSQVVRDVLMRWTYLEVVNLAFVPSLATLPTLTFPENVGSYPTKHSANYFLSISFTAAFLPKHLIIGLHEYIVVYTILIECRYPICQAKTVQRMLMTRPTTQSRSITQWELFLWELQARKSALCDVKNLC